jgi:circadian clock protein KaiC
LLASASLNAGAAGADEHYLTIERLIDLHHPRLLVIDPLSAFVKSGGHRIADIVSERLVNLVKARGITALFTAVADSDLGELESSSSRVSTIADNWIHVSFAAQCGERNRTLTILKARGTGHSNQMRELVLSDDGLDLKDVYFAAGAVLLGTARVEKERQEAAEARLRDSQDKHALAEVDERRRTLEAQLERTRSELAAVIEERRRMMRQVSEVERSLGADQAAILASRGGDPEASGGPANASLKGSSA